MGVCAKRLTFTAAKEGDLFAGMCGNKKLIACAFRDGELSVLLWYDFSETPLKLTGKASAGDSAELLVLPYRIELHINGKLADEEWPYGSCKLEACVLTDNGCGLQMTETDYTPPQVPSVVATFQHAEGWKPEENIFVGDCMPYAHEGAYHVLYLKDRHHHCSKWVRGAHQWAHISSEDLVNWRIHPMAVEIDDSREGSICTGSWICASGRQYLFYTVRMCDGSPAEICRSVSEDGYHFEKDRDFSFTLSERFCRASARDPKVIRAADGCFHMLLTTSHTESGRGCLAHLISQDLENWQELDEPLLMAGEGEGEPECPDYFYKDGYYYLVYSLHAKGYYRFSKEPFSNWQLPDDPIIPCKSVPKAAVINDRLIFAGFDGAGVYAGTLTFLEAKVQRNGTLVYNATDM